MSWKPVAPAALLALAACGAAPAPSPDPSPRPSASTTTQDGAFAACRTRADGDAAAIQACADTELARIAHALPDHPEAATRHAAALRALGDDAIARGTFGQGAAAQVAVADAAVRLSQQRAAWLAGGTPPAGRGDPTRLGDAARAAWSASRAAACAAYRVTDCAARYDALLNTYQPAAEPTPMPEPATTNAGLPLPDCAEVKAAGLVGGALGDAFYRRYPTSLADPKGVDHVTLDGAAIDNVVGYLACVATLTDGDPTVADNAAALFASPRHGVAAFAALTTRAKAETPEGKGAARFLQQMKAMVD
ncbi:hypothetical protein COA17_15185 [Sphingomonas ginsenosidimutans]|uniref:Lysozyme inhibitor LprI N-terminal domain-containing protein n=1 Tax=Sphingomonas ginsenosidimutans TaxID=862134 RepID=A0A2A4HVL9_9SPHN|nr:hypothetical protein [Sphingomonas ginsenosidimutans]PCG08081.1 hypothetical protein COA17_15185 [Sphingomonas ginsenosidimutans]